MIEADFYREYRLDVTSPEVMQGMTLRRFMVLAFGLSAESRFALALSKENTDPGGTKIINDPQAAERAVLRALA